MKFFVRENFLKNIPKEKRKLIENKLYYFYSEIENNKNNIREIPNGFWIKKIKGFPNRFEFRVNNGDRIFFSLERRDSEDERITFILYSTHDKGILKNKRLKLKTKNDFTILKKEIKEENISIEEEKELIKNYNDIISYEFKNDDFFKKTENKRYYYLNDEQYKTLKKKTPLFVAGSAGSGKSTITLRKLLNLENYQKEYNINRIGYFTRNSFLKEDIKSKYDIFRDPKNRPITEFYSLNDYYRKKLGVDKRKIVNFESFKTFIKFSFPNIKKLKLELLNIYFEIIAILEGLMSSGDVDNWKRDFSTKFLSFENYLNLNKNYSILNENQKIEVYKICKKYNTWKEENSYYDSNDLALKCLNEIEYFDFIVIDEIQDFTEVEIFLLFSLIKNKNNLLVAGDIHQMIAFNSFSFERIRNLYYGENISFFESMLSKNYRNSKLIVDLANSLTDMRKEYIGNKGIEDYKENFVIEEGTLNISNINFDILKKMNRSNAAILVSDYQDKKMLLEKGLHRIFTVEEIKGLEYEDIICFNLISKNLWAWKKIFSKTVKLDQRYRKYFNLFYVGITRAIKNLVIMEEEIDNNPLLEKIDKIFNLNNENDSTVNKIIGNKLESTKEEWYIEGQKLYKLDKIEEAKEAFINAGDPTWILRKEIEEDILNEDYKIALNKIEANNLTSIKIKYEKMIIDNIILNNKETKCLKYIVDIFNIGYRYEELKKIISKKLINNEYKTKELNKMIPYLIKKNEHILLGDIYFYKKEYQLALKAYQKSDNKNKILDKRLQILKIKFENINNLEKKLQKIKDIIPKKDINYFDRNKLTPLFKALKYKDTDILDMIIFLGGSTKKKGEIKYPILNYIAYKNFDNSIELVNYFLNKGLNINERDSNLENMLFHSIRNRNKKLTTFLLEKKIDINIKNIRNENLLFQCLLGFDAKNFKLFLNLGLNYLEKNWLDLEIKDCLTCSATMSDIENRTIRLIKKILERFISNSKDISK